MEERSEEQKEYSRNHYREWRKNNREADERIKLRYWARKVLSLSPDEIYELLKPRSGR